MKFRRICDQLVPADREAAEWYASLSDSDVVEVDVKVLRQRTQTQSAAMHRWCGLLAQELNAAGYDMRAFPFKEGAEIPWTKETVKSNLWRPIQIAMTGHHSTTKPKTVDYPAIYEVLNRKIASSTGVHVPWPERDTWAG